MEYKATIERIGETVQVTERFRKREFVVTDGDGSYPQTCLFECTNDRVDLLDSVAVGDEVNIKFNLRGRKWKNPQGEEKVFNTLQAWAITKTGATNAGTKAEAPVANILPDDLPF